LDPGNIVARPPDRQRHRGRSPSCQPIAVVFTIPRTKIPAVLARLGHGASLPVEAYDREQQRKLSTGSLLTIDKPGRFHDGDGQA